MQCLLSPSARAFDDGRRRRRLHHPGSGTVLPVAMEAGKRLAEAGLPVRIVSWPSVKPMDEALLAECMARFPVIVSVEEQSILGCVAARGSRNG